jgi:hypothetical protein
MRSGVEWATGWEYRSGMKNNPSLPNWPVWGMSGVMLGYIGLIAFEYFYLRIDARTVFAACLIALALGAMLWRRRA